MSPQIVSSYEGGKHNANITHALSRMEKSGIYKDLSVIVVIPALASVPTKAVASWLNLYYPPNQRVVKMFAMGFEVGEAYSRTIENILLHPELAKYKYLLTLEHDNIPPPDGVVNILAQMENHPEYSAIGGLYWTKGEGGVPQIWGNPAEAPLNFKPQAPRENGLVECCGTGMGFTAFRMSMFKDERLRKPWFKTTASITEGAMTQDLYFWMDARKHGHRCAIDCAIRIGHYSLEQDLVW